MRRRGTASLTTGDPGQTSPAIRNALSADSDIGGGYLTASEEFSTRLIEVVDNEVFIRRLATKTMLATAQSLGIAARTTDRAADDAVHRGVGDRHRRYGADARQARVQAPSAGQAHPDLEETDPAE